MVTGANSGLGLGDRPRARHARRATRARGPGPREGGGGPGRDRGAAPGAELERSELDLASLDSVREFATGFAGPRGLDVLVNNAGVMTPPKRETADGFELQFGTNHLGHFALTGLLIDSLAGGRDDAIGGARRPLTASPPSAFMRSTVVEGDRGPRLPAPFQWRAN